MIKKDIKINDYYSVQNSLIFLCFFFSCFITAQVIVGKDTKIVLTEHAQFLVQDSVYINLPIDSSKNHKLSDKVNTKLLSKKDIYRKKNRNGKLFINGMKASKKTIQENLTKKEYNSRIVLPVENGKNSFVSIFCQDVKFQIPNNFFQSDILKIQKYRAEVYDSFGNQTFSFFKKYIILFHFIDNENPMRGPPLNEII
ncbi:hypothetical protein [Empedobacter brevis]|uniref:hypothetical protein n=1 Tax=Empedobacter brevis TaxID=247 RepID=UPI00333E8BFE